MEEFSAQLSGHERLQMRRRTSEQQVDRVQKHLETDGRPDLFLNGNTTVYLAGSLGRGEVGKQSDLDLFLLTTRHGKERSRLDDLEMLACVIETNRILKYGPLSNDGQYLKIYRLDEMLRALGAPQDDSENLFTARMLLLLESRCVFNRKIYDEAVHMIIAHYFRDSRGKTTFRPLFLLNDILRYWRTLCLNYELARDDQNRPWRKKNINLKFSRMLTVFGTVLPLIARPMSDTSDLRELMRLSPHQRFSRGLDIIGDSTFHDGYGQFLDDYESFLQWKEEIGSVHELSDANLNHESRCAASRYAKFIYSVLMHETIDPEYRRFLVL